MKTLKQTAYVVLFAFLAIAAGCSKSDDSNPLDPDGNGNGNAGAPHKYDITIDGQRYSGEVNNDEATHGGVANLLTTDGITKVVFTLLNNDINVVAVFQYPNGQGNNVSIDEDAESGIGFLPGGFNNNIAYYSKSGTAKLIVGEKIDLGADAGYIIALQVEFQGTLSYNDDNGDEQIVQASGTFKINLPEY